MTESPHHRKARSYLSRNKHAVSVQTWNMRPDAVDALARLSLAGMKLSEVLPVPPKPYTLPKSQVDRHERATQPDRLD